MANAHFVQDFIPARVGLAVFPHRDIPFPNHPVLITKYSAQQLQSKTDIVATHVLIRRSLVSMDDDPVPVSGRVCLAPNHADS